ncbi:MAG TPA: TetR/AcrR family transcriptional regulator [Steroidobacteraceae bacterium]|nr:TetR/AcrR family transcriptional regulator [Steroidobacteraceae bacterium]
MRRKTSKAARRGGRPSSADAIRLRGRILEAATELFLKEGYGATSIGAVAASARVSKRTLYDRFDDKAVLFAAVVHAIIERIRPPPEVPLIEGATLEDILCRIAHMILHAALSPQGLALYRLVAAESARFPELASAVAGDESNREATHLIASLLMRDPCGARLSPEDREFAATQFLFMVATVPRRRATGYGTPMTAAELEIWARRVVRLFLGGCRALGA